MPQVNPLSRIPASGAIANTSSRAFAWGIAIMATVIFASSHASISAPAIPAIDKIAHFAVFGLLATHFVRSPRLHKNPWLAVVAVSLFGVADEWHQSNVPGRSCDALDWLADTLGAALATSLHEHAPFYRRMLDFRIQLKVPLRAQ